MIFIFVFFTLLISLYLLWFIPKKQTELLNEVPNSEQEIQQYTCNKDRIEIEDAIRKTIAQIVGGIVILGSLAFAYKTYQIQIEKQDLDREGLFTDRFNNAIDKLKSEDRTVRIGGLYALERLSKDQTVSKDSQKDYWMIMEILCAYIREKSSVFSKDEKEPQQSLNSNANIDEANYKITNQNFTLQENRANQKIQDIKIPEDIQTAITIIGRRDFRNDLGIINLRYTNLSGVDLSSLYLSKSNLSGANLSNAEFYETNLSGADLRKADLSKVKLWEGTISRELVRLNNHWIADLSNAKLEGAKFYNADLSYMNLSGLNFSNIHLENAILTKSELFNTNFSNAFLTNVNLSQTALYKTNFSNAHLEFAYLTNATNKAPDKEEIFRRQSSEDIKIWSSNFSNAILTGTDFSGMWLPGNDKEKEIFPDDKPLNFDQMSVAIINNDTKINSALASQKELLIEMSKQNITKRNAAQRK